MTSLFTRDNLLGREDRRILAVWFPYLPTERIWRRRLGRSWRSKREATMAPLVLSRYESNTYRVAALDEQAERLGLKCGMGLADARAMHPGIDVVESDVAADRTILEGLADWCDRYTPLVALSDGDGLFLDISGCVHLFGGEDALLGDLVRQLAWQGFKVSAGLASTPGAAWAAARYRLPPIACGDEEAELARLPLAALRIEEAARGGLESVGLRTVGAILSAPRAPLARRFGKHLLLRLDQATGTVEEAISPRLPVAVLSVERHLAEPIETLDDVERLLALLAGTLKSDLERRGQGARRLQLSLFRVDGAVCRVAVGTSRPMRDPPRIARLFHERLSALGSEIDTGYGFDLVRLSVLVAARFDEVQGDLGGTASDAEEDIALFADRVRARLGDRSIRRPVPIASHMPERAVALAPFTEPNPRAPIIPKTTGNPDRTIPLHLADRPARLFADPEAIDVTAEIPEGPPANFRWRRALYRISSSEGPERIASEWWRQPQNGPQDEAQVRPRDAGPQHGELQDAALQGRRPRDYYKVEDEQGRRFWLYREGVYGEGAPPRWFVQGLFA